MNTNTHDHRHCLLSYLLCICRSLFSGAVPPFLQCMVKTMLRAALRPPSAPSPIFRLAGINSGWRTGVGALKMQDRYYCYYNLPYSQLNRLQQIQNCLARAIFKAPKFTHTTHILKSLHWLKINQCIDYKILSLTYKVLTIYTAQPG